MSSSLNIVLLAVALTACGGSYRASEPATPTEIELPACTPAAGEVALYEDAGFRGRCAILRPGDYESPLAMAIDDDAVSSMIVGDGALAIACTDPAFRGACTTLAGSVDRLPTDDSLSSLRVVAAR
jgi:hypothetical protein